MNTPNFVKLERALDTSFEIGRGYIDRKMKDLEEMAHKGSDDSRESEGKIWMGKILPKE